MKRPAATFSRRKLLSGLTAAGGTFFAFLKARPAASQIADSGGAVPDLPSALFLAEGAGAAARTVQVKLREVALSITDFGAVADGNADSTSALHSAVEALGPNGGYVEIPPGVFRLNAVIARHNVVLRGKGGKGAHNQACLRPYDLARPTLTFGDDTADYHYCGIENLHVSGSDATRNGFALAAHNAPHALLLKGGIINFAMRHSALFNGVQSLALKPSTTNPISGFRMPGSAIRNDVMNSTSARCIYSTRRGVGDDSGYNTDNRFDGKINSTGLGYAAEFDGIDAGIAAEVGGYWDVKPGLGILLKGGATGIYAYGLDLDPGASNVAVIETDQTAPKDPARFITGLLRHGGQAMKWGDGTTTAIPAYCETFSHQPRISAPFLSDVVYFAPVSSPYSTNVYLDFQTDSGPLRWNGIKHRWTDTTDATSAFTGAMGTAGGISAAKSIYAGAKVVTTTGFFHGGTKVVGARQPAIADAMDARTAVTQLNRALAALRAHGLIET
jgi:hypothetical protein